MFLPRLRLKNKEKERNPAAGEGQRIPDRSRRPIIIIRQIG
jgi:hypothetical protein